MGSSEARPWYVWPMDRKALIRPGKETRRLLEPMGLPKLEPFGYRGYNAASSLPM